MSLRSRVAAISVFAALVLVCTVVSSAWVLDIAGTGFGYRDVAPSAAFFVPFSQLAPPTDAHIEREHTRFRRAWATGLGGVEPDNTQSACSVRTDGRALAVEKLDVLPFPSCAQYVQPLDARFASEGDGALVYTCPDGRVFLAPHAADAQAHAMRSRRVPRLQDVLECATMEVTEEGVSFLSKESTDGRDFFVLECPSARATSPTLLHRVWRREDVVEQRAKAFAARGADAVRFSRVLLLTLDATSRPAFFRYMPQTAAVLERVMAEGKAGTGTHDVVGMKRHNVAGAGTQQNLLKLLSGAYANAWHHRFLGKHMDSNLPWLHTWAARNGYVTMYATDECRDRYQPDWYAAPVVDHIFWMPFCHDIYLRENPNAKLWCLFGRTKPHITYDALRSFFDAYASDTTVGTFAHAHIVDGHSPDTNQLHVADASTAAFVEEFLSDPDAVLVISADHGPQFGSFYTTELGNVEQRWIPLVMAVPKHIGLDTERLARNAQRASSHLDTYLSMCHLLSWPAARSPWDPLPTTHAEMDAKVRGFWPWFNARGMEWNEPGQTVPRMYALWDPAFPDRSCSEISVPRSFCLCDEWATVEDLAGAPVHEAVDVAVRAINTYTAASPDGGACTRVHLDAVLSAKRLEYTVQRKGDVMHVPDGAEERVVEWQLRFRTVEGHAEFASHVRAVGNGGKWEVTSGERTSVYAHEPCHAGFAVADRQLSNYCICR